MKKKREMMCMLTPSSDKTKLTNKRVRMHKGENELFNEHIYLLNFLSPTQSIT